MTVPKLLRDKLALPVIGMPMFIVSGPELVTRLQREYAAAPARPGGIAD